MDTNSEAAATANLQAPDATAPWAEIARWRRAQRDRLLAQRLAVPSFERRELSTRIAARVAELVGDVAGLTISAYWPIRGEPDLRAFLEDAIARGAQGALPVVIERGQPLVFRAWVPGERLARGVWNIPIPPDDAPVVVPDVILAPVVGFDPACYRLGYGGGFFDRTLAQLSQIHVDQAGERPIRRVIGVGYAQAELASILPQPHDIPMDWIVTEENLLRCGYESA